MLPVIIIMYILLVPCVALFIYEKYKGQELAATVFKGVSTWIVICAALVGTMGIFGGGSVYSSLIIAGLSMGLAGDIALCFHKQGFMQGMLFFGLGHCCYIAAMISVLDKAVFAIPVFAFIYAIVLIVFRKNKIKFGKLFVPVLIYGTIITCMLSLALAAPISIFPNGLALLFAGAFFAVSDAMLAKNSFSASDDKVVTLTSSDRSGAMLLIFYYIGQSLFAASIYLF